MKEKIRKILTVDHGVVYGDFPGLIADLETLFNQEVEKRIKEIDQHGRIAASVIKKKLWSMRFNEEDVKKETDGRRKRFIYGYTEAINDISQWLTEMVDICRRSRLTCSEKPNNSKGGEG